MSCSPSAGAWEWGWTPVECGSAWLGETGSWTAGGGSWAVQPQRGCTQAASVLAMALRGSYAAQMSSSLQIGSCHDIPGPEQDHQGVLVCLDSWGRPSRLCSATHQPEDHQDLTAWSCPSSEVVWTLESWGLSQAACGPFQKGKGTGFEVQEAAALVQDKSCRTGCTFLAEPMREH